MSKEKRVRGPPTVPRGRRVASGLTVPSSRQKVAPSDAGRPRGRTTVEATLPGTWGPAEHSLLPRAPALPALGILPHHFQTSSWMS